MKRLSGFSLMEMMIVLTIVAIIAAVSAPMVNKKMVSSNSTGSLWQKVGQAIFYSSGHVAMGTNQVNNGQLNIKTTDNKLPHIAFSSNNGSNMLLNTSNNNVWLTTADLENVTNTVVMGNSSAASNNGCVAIGNNAQSYAADDIAIGTNTESGCGNSIAIGNGAKSNTAGNTTAIGYDARATQFNTTAIGTGAHATYTNSTAIGAGAKTIRSNLIVLGTSYDTVYIPGNLYVVGGAVIGSNKNGTDNNLVYIKNGTKGVVSLNSSGGTWKTDVSYSNPSLDIFSDRRLKNVGKAFQGGLAELKKLDLYNYTFKDDKAKTPRVGVMAQDLKKIFPNAVTKGEDGFLRIRMEDMFYAVVNAVKELDTRLNSQNKRIEELEKQNQELMKRIEKLERSK